MGGVPKIRDTILAVLILRITVFWGLYWVPHILGNCRMDFQGPGDMSTAAPNHEYSTHILSSALDCAKLPSMLLTQGSIFGKNKLELKQEANIRGPCTIATSRPSDPEK